MQYEEKVMLQEDWAKNGAIIKPDEAQSSFYGERANFNVHTG